MQLDPVSPVGLDRAERAREILAPAVSLLSSSLLLCCLVTLPDVVSGWRELSGLDDRLAGWSGVALVVAMATAGISLALCTRIGPGPPLALGVIAGVLGLALSREVGSGGQAVVAVVTLALAVGPLFAGGLCLAEGLAPAPARLALLGWLLPLVGGWGPVGWLALHGRSDDRTRIGLHPPGWALALITAVLLLGAVLTLLLEPRRRPDPWRAGWENTWAALAMVVIGAASIVMLVGFQSELTSTWARPVVLLGVAVVLAGLAACGWVLPLATARPAYTAVVVAFLVGPGCVHALLLVPARSSGSLSGWLLPILAMAGLIGAWVGWRTASDGATAGLVVMALAVAGGWVMPANQWVACAAAAPLCAGVAATGAGGLRTAAATRTGLRYVSLSGLGALLLGLICAAPIAWAFGVGMTGGEQADLRPGGRVLLGLSFAITVLAAAVVSVLPSQRRTHDVRATEHDAARLCGRNAPAP